MSMTNHQKDQILQVIKYYITTELRERIMREVPVAYNAWVGYAVVEVKEVETDLADFHHNQRVENRFVDMSHKRIMEKIYAFTED
jgi:hypothetical protein